MYGFDICPLCNHRGPVQSSTVMFWEDKRSRIVLKDFSPIPSPLCRISELTAIDGKHGLRNYGGFARGKNASFSPQLCFHCTSTLLWSVETKTTIMMGNCHAIRHSPVSSLVAEKQVGKTEKVECWSALTKPDRTTYVRDHGSCGTGVSVPDSSGEIFLRSLRSSTSSELHLPLSLLQCSCKELGDIKYQFSSMEEAKSESRRRGKPILCFEIEIPGDQVKGKEIFSHPLVVEAAESLFVILRQTPRKCRQPVPSTKVRILDESGVDLVVGIGGDALSLASMASLMISGLKALRLSIPNYLMLLEEEESGKVKHRPDGSIQRTGRQAFFGMPNSQIGEIEFGCLDGVLATRTGFIGRQLVLQVTYDSTKLSYCNLTRFALQKRMTNVVYYGSNDERIAAIIEVKRVEGHCDSVKYTGPVQPGLDSKHALRQTMLRYVPLTDLQAMKANRLVATGVFNEATHLLSPRQGVILMKCMHSATRRTFTEVVDVPIAQAWRSLSGEQ
jgi:hypothetical protein